MLNTVVFFALTLVLLHLLVGLSLLPSLPGPLLPWLGGALLVASCTLIPLGVRARRLNQPALAWASLLAVGTFGCLTVLTLLRALVIAASWLLNRPLSSTAEAYSALAVWLLTLAVTLAGLVNARRTARVKTVEVTIAGLPAAFDGYRIAQISDIHIGLTIGRRYLERIVARVNQQGADLVAVTGDLVDGSVAQLADPIAPLGDLQGKDGVALVLGNHEYYSGADAWIAQLNTMGLPPLLNQHRVIQRGEATLVVAGVTDWSAASFNPAQASDPARALAGAPANTVAILLAHQPRSAPAAEAAGFALQLSGHTHGGQFWPWMYFVRFSQPWVAGLHRLGKLQVYISRGTGYWGPPMRLGAPSEITLLRLHTA